MADTQAEQRFGQLIGRTFGLKISVLVLLLIALFVVWSTLTSGRQKAEQVDKEFCQQLAKDTYYGPGNVAFCEPAYLAQNTIRVARHAHDYDPYETDEKLEKLNERLHTWAQHVQQFEEYDQRRRRAYQIELSLPYTKGPVFLDGALISDIWPFCALLAVAAAVALGFKQRCYEIHLTALLRKVKLKDARAREFALAEFSAGSLCEVNVSGKPVFLYKKPFTFSPQTVGSAFLLIVVLLLSLRLLTDYSAQFSERGEEDFSGYYFWLYLFSVFLAFLLSRTRRLWRASLDEVLGGDVRSARFYGPVEWPWASLAASRFNAVTTVLCAALALGSLCFHWEGSFRGIELLWHPTAVITDDVLFARSAQFALILSIVFLLLCLISMVMGHTRYGCRLTVVIRRPRRYCAWAVLILLSFPIPFTLLTSYGEFMDLYLLPRLGAGFDYPSFLNLQNLPAMEADVSRGLLVFLFSCLFLACINVLSSKHSNVSG
jgi:hypothetical protein